MANRKEPRRDAGAPFESRKLAMDDEKHLLHDVFYVAPPEKTRHDAVHVREVRFVHLVESSDGAMGQERGVVRGHRDQNRPWTCKPTPWPGPPPTDACMPLCRRRFS